MTETHPFPFFIPSRPRLLIIGSFPCLKHNSYGDWFYSGSGKNYFWPLLSEVFGLPAGTQKEKQALCEAHGIALTDICYKIQRLQHNCSDSGLRIVEFNKEAIDKCLSSGIKRIFFTSRFVEREFLKHYPDNRLPVFTLISPSPSANRHIGGLAAYKEFVRKGLINSPYSFRLMHYRALLLQKAGNS